MPEICLLILGPSMLLHSLYLIAEHPLDFITHSFQTCGAKMDFNPVGCLADSFLKCMALYALCGQRRSIVCCCDDLNIGVHRRSLSATCFPSTSCAEYRLALTVSVYRVCCARHLSTTTGFYQKFSKKEA